MVFLLAFLSAAPTFQTPDLYGYAKGRQLASVTVPVNTPRLATGLVCDDNTFYIARIEGTQSSDQGRRRDAFYIFTDPYSPEDMPRHTSALEILEDDDTVYRNLPLYEPPGSKPVAYRDDHVYEVVLHPKRTRNFTLASPATYWDYPSNKPKDNLNAGQITVTFYEAVKDTGPRMQFDAIDAHRFFDPNSTQSVIFPLLAPPLRGAISKMGNLPAQPIAGVVADGASLILLRLAAPMEGKATFTLSPSDGALYPLVSNPFRSGGSKAVDADTTLDPGPATPKMHFAFAIYRPPSNYRNVLDAKVKIACHFSPADSSKPEKDDELWLHIVKPPVLLVHGTYDDPVTCWQTRNPEDDSPFPMTQRLKNAGFDYVSCVDWESTNGNQNPSAFVDNASTVYYNKGGLSDLIAKMRADGYAVTQADVVCHSQGGVITRVFARGYGLRDPMGPTHPHFSDPWKCMELGCKYHTARNYGVGDIHRLITVSTTHMGSDICRLLDTYGEFSDATKSLAGIWLDIFRATLHVAASGIFTGGFRDQVPGSGGLRAIGPTPVPSHAVACVCSDAEMTTQYDAFYYSRMFKIWTASTTSAIDWTFRKLGQPEDAEKLKELQAKMDAANPVSRKAMINEVLYAFRAAVFGHDENDCTVRMTSSFGGLTEKYRSRATGVLHGFAPRYKVVQNRIIELLRDVGSSFDPNGFPDAYNGARTTISAAIVPLEWSQESISRTQPFPSDIVNPPPPSNTNSVGPTPITGAAHDAWDAAMKEWQKGNLSGAAQKMTEAINVDPQNAQLHAQFAGLLIAQGKFVDSEAQMREAVRLQPANIEFRCSHGTTLFDIYRFADAEAEYREALRIKPDYAPGLGGLGVMLNYQGKYADAEKVLRDAVRLAPSVAEFQCFLGDSLGFQGKWDLAEPFYKECVRLNPNIPGGHAGLSGCYAMKGKLAEAEVEVRTAIRIDPRQPTCHANLAGILLREGKRDEAIREAQEAKRLGLATHPIYGELGIG